MGKTNIKLSACTAAGQVVEVLAAVNEVRPGPPWRHHDLRGAGEWAMAGLADLAGRHPIGHLIPTGHGSGGVLVGDDPDNGAVLPMVDYEQALPAGLDADYAPLSGGFLDRGSAVMHGATHQARQLFWMERAEPAAFARARWYLGLPQYWAWWLTGIPASEITMMGAQSHLWNVPERRFAPIVASQGWGRLMPGFAAPWAVLGLLRPALAQRYGLPEGMAVHTGLHDSSANFTRYQAAGLRDLAVVSTGTWIVALADRVPMESLMEAQGMTCNADITGAPLGGALTMGGREFSAVAGEQAEGARVDAGILAQLVASGTLALPMFGPGGGQFPGRAGRGRIVGPAPVMPAERLALAVLYAALLTVACIDKLGASRRVVLDGSFLRDPAFAGLVAALRPGAETLYNPESYGVAAGAALLCCHPHQTPTPIRLERPDPLWQTIPGLAPYGARWRDLAGKAPIKGNEP